MPHLSRWHIFYKGYAERHLEGILMVTNAAFKAQTNTNMVYRKKHLQIQVGLFQTVNRKKD